MPSYGDIERLRQLGNERFRLSDWFGAARCYTAAMADASPTTLQDDSCLGVRPLLGGFTFGPCLVYLCALFPIIIGGGK